MMVQDEKLSLLREKEKALYIEIFKVREELLSEIKAHFNIDIGDIVECPTANTKNGRRQGIITRIGFSHTKFDSISFSAVGIKKDGSPSLKNAGIYCDYNKLALVKKRNL